MRNPLLTITVAVALASGGCLGDMDEDMSDLFKGVNPGAFGNSTVVVPAQANSIAPLGSGEEKTVVKFPGPVRRANPDQEVDPAVITASIYAMPQPTVSVSGPITGIALWGSGGGGMQEAEFDIPVGTNVDPDIAIADPTPYAVSRGGTFISVIGTSLEIRARNDARLLPAGPALNGSNQFPIGGTVADPPAGSAPVLVTASLGKGVKSTATHGATKTVWAVNSGAPGALVPAAAIFIRIPPFSKSFRVCRGLAGVNAPAIGILIFGNTGTGDGIYTVAAGVVAPEIKLSGQETGIRVTNNEAANNITSLYVVFYLSL